MTLSRREFLSGLAAGAAATATLYGLAAAEKSKPKKPNIVFILSDDQGWNGLSVQMHPDMPDSKSDYYRTPVLERLASEGMRFSDAYAPAPMCTPTRASLLTGKSPAQLGMTTPGPSRKPRAWEKLEQAPHTSVLPSDTTTIGTVLGRAGYATAYFGKWHLGTVGPGEFGFDASDGPTGNENGNVQDPANPKDIFGITERGSAFMEKSVKEGRPFYLQLWHYAVHGPLQSLKETLEASEARPKGEVHTDPTFAATTEDLDAGVGMTLKKIEELGIADNTFVIYMSDNGAGPRFSPNTPLANGKGSLWEGGIREPLIVRGPGVKAGAFCGERVAGWDLFPTFCELAGVEEPLPEGLEGGSLTPLFSSGKGAVKRPREEVAFHYPHYGQGGEGKSPQSALYLGDFKLMKFYEAGELKLFNLKNDIGEQKDLSEELPEKTDLMHKRLNAYLKQVGAALPKPNPDYDPNAPVERRPPPSGARRGAGAGQRPGAGGRRRPRGQGLGPRRPGGAGTGPGQRPGDL